MIVFEHEQVSKAIIGAAFEVNNIRGHGFLENVYQNAMQVELIQREHRCQTESLIKVYYKNVVVGDYRADLTINEVIVVELKVAKTSQSADEAQLMNELKTSEIKVGPLINFGRPKKLSPNESCFEKATDETRIEHRWRNRFAHLYFNLWPDSICYSWLLLCLRVNASRQRIQQGAYQYNLTKEASAGAFGPA